MSALCLPSIPNSARHVRERAEADAAGPASGWPYDPDRGAAAQLQQPRDLGGTRIAWSEQRGQADAISGQRIASQ